MHEDCRKKVFLKLTAQASGYNGPLTGFEECKACGGECCKKNACNCVPADFTDLSPTGIEKILNTGKYMITAFYANAEMPNGIPIRAIPVIAAREVNCAENGIHISMMHGACAMLGPNGCKLTKDERPSQGLLLIPRGKDCEDLVDAPTLYWREYSEFLDQVIKKRTGKTAQQLFEEELPPLATKIKHKIQFAVLFGGSISYSEYMAAKAMKDLGVFCGLFREELGNVINNFVEHVTVEPV